MTEGLPEPEVWTANVYGGVPPMAVNVTLLPTWSERDAGVTARLLENAWMTMEAWAALSVLSVTRTFAVPAPHGAV